MTPPLIREAIKEKHRGNPRCFSFLTQSSIIGLAAGTAIFCVFAAGTAIGTADTFAAVFLLLPYIKSGKADHESDYHYKNNVFHRTVPFIFYFLDLFFAVAQRYAINPAIARTAASPGTNAAPKEPVVIRVPI